MLVISVTTGAPHTSRSLHTMRMLVGDIGGTNARLLMYEASEEKVLLGDQSISSHKVVSQMFYKNNDFKSFAEVLWAFMSLPENNNIKVDSCCFAVAGPVSNNQINFTNREGWIVDGSAIEEDLNIDKVQLLNDFVANGYGLLALSENELVTLQEGKRYEQGTAPMALVGAGTGLGECFLTPDGSGDLRVFPTEGGHVEFAPRTTLETELLSFLQNRLSTHGEMGDGTDSRPRVSVERLVSGKGLENIYEFLREKYPEQVNATIDNEYNESNERGRLIGHEKYNYYLFKRTLEIMFSVFGSEAGNVALKYLPYGGLYIAGGIAPKNLEFVTNQDSEFMPRFLDKGRMSSIMSDFPVHVVMREDLGLRGAHIVASRLCVDLLSFPGANKSRLNGNVNEQGIGRREPRESAFSLSQAVRVAVQDYPLAYAFVTAMTAAVTAGTVVATQYYLRISSISK